VPTSRALACLAILLALIQLPAPLHGETTAPDVVKYDAGRLTVHVDGMPLNRLLGEIVAVTHATVRGTVAARPVTMDFRELPLSDGLTRIFGAESFMLTYAGDGTVRLIEVLGAGPAIVPVATGRPITTPTPRSPLADAEEQAIVLQRLVIVSGPLAEALGGEQAPVGQVLHAAVQARDPAARAAARETALGAIADPAVETAYLSTLTPVDDATLATILRAMNAEGAQEWMTALAARAPSAELRAKAAAVLAALRH
jgi:hypothetical protein